VAASIPIYTSSSSSELRIIRYPSPESVVSVSSVSSSQGPDINEGRRRALSWNRICLVSVDKSFPLAQSTVVEGHRTLYNSALLVLLYSIIHSKQLVFQVEYNICYDMVCWSFDDCRWGFLPLWMN